VTARRRTLAIATALAAVLGGLVAWALLAVERPDVAAEARHEQDSRALPFRPSDVVAVAVAARGAAEAHLARVDGAWRLPPPRGEANGPAVDGLLTQLASMRVRSAAPADPGTLASRGLDPPVCRLTLTLRDGSRLGFDLGDESPFDGARFARRADRLLVVTGVPPALLDPALERLLSAPGGG